MKSAFRITKILVLVLSLSSCAKIYTNQDLTPEAYNRDIIAILPPSVSIADMEDLKADTISESLKNESLGFQLAIYEWMLQKRMELITFPEIQDIETTNAKLNMAAYPETPYSSFELCEILGVDGIMDSNFSIRKSMTDEDAVALALLYPLWGPKNEMQVSLSIRECTNNKLIWKYDQKYFRVLETDPFGLVDALMKQATRTMPYSQKPTKKGKKGTK